MAKNIIVSNRLPIQITKLDNSFEFTATSGGLATGMNSVHMGQESLWVGWPGINEEQIDKDSWGPLKKSLGSEGFFPVSLNDIEIENFYFGLSNKALWPLFHYFIEYSVFKEDQWSSYIEVNKKFADSVIQNIKKGDTIWIHDYQLLLCPKMIKDVRPDVTIGFFLHIPFPSFEIFRIFPWREPLLEGMLGADLIGFHTYDYERHFLSSVKRILKKEVSFNRVSLGNREVVVNTFPMGIDYDKFNTAATSHLAMKQSEKSDLKKQLELHKKGADKGKLILSIDRLDYTKGVINRIKAFELFLTKYPEYLEKVRLVMLTVPSRSSVSDYKRLKKETDEIVGRVNGKFATVNWTPIWYYYRAMAFDDLIDLYMTSDIGMITPVRDGMNLVAKEFVATRVSGDGVLILSEMAGASKELYEALMVNPFDLNQMAESILTAINMPVEEQKKRNLSMQKRLRRYSVKLWANEFMKALKSKPLIEEEYPAQIINKKINKNLIEKFKNSKRRMILLDYDGTLVDFHDDPELAQPEEDLILLVKKMSGLPNTDVAIVSGRDQTFLDRFFGNLPIALVAEHGYLIKLKNGCWTSRGSNQLKWQKDILPLLETFTDRTPGTFIEEKKNSLVWHYRKTDPELAVERVVELKTVLTSLISDDLNILDGDKAIEVAFGRFNKGTAVSEIISDKELDFILCIGDDVTDEFMFNDLPKHATTVKVGKRKTQAKYFIENPTAVKNFLKSLIN
ncbi:MAG: bifunctional alpha,alpha-trehalose-phosphate synthase (UDP-forming)/trehalose-phosphatase [Bacteroidota bacterium]|nr:bifunctional alpha,alpha-trehalose-phosphate synthase (UDP-forming)/trehalose-phosphatase [Bacteroidota bacterium]